MSAAERVHLFKMLVHHGENFNQNGVICELNDTEPAVRPSGLEFKGLKFNALLEEQAARTGRDGMAPDAVREDEEFEGEGILDNPEELAAVIRRTKKSRMRGEALLYLDPCTKISLDLKALSLDTRITGKKSVLMPWQANGIGDGPS